MKPTISTREHYDRLAESGHGRNDPPVLLEYMARWDGPLFWNAVGELTGKDVLEVGVGVGRIARQVLSGGCGSFTGLDISSKTIAAVQEDLAEFANASFELADIDDFVRPASFDVVFSVLTFMHIKDKRVALEHMVDSLRPGGCVVLSIDKAADSFSFGDWKVDLYPWSPEQYAEVFRDLGCETDPLVPLVDTWISSGQESETYGQTIATLVKALKP